MTHSAQVQELVRKGWLWQGQDTPPHKAETKVLATGWAELDQKLGGGWLEGSVNELQVQRPFIGELALLLPCFTAMEGTAVWLNPPATPYSPGLGYQQLSLHQHMVVQEDDAKLALWALEQCIKNSAVSVVVGWFENLSAPQVRRLQQAAEAAGKLVFIITAWQQQEEARAYVTRLQLSYQQQSLQIAIKKRRFGWPLASFPCNVQRFLPERRQAV